MQLTLSTFCNPHLEISDNPSSCGKIREKSKLPEQPSNIHGSGNFAAEKVAKHTHILEAIVVVGTFLKPCYFELDPNPLSRPKSPSNSR